MDQIKFDSENYIFFNDYKDIMIQAFGIGCSLCGSNEIFFVLKGSPKPIGRLVKQQQNNLTDEAMEDLIAQPLLDWQKFDDLNSEQMIPTFLCDECFNTLD